MHLEFDKAPVPLLHQPNEHERAMIGGLMSYLH